MPLRPPGRLSGRAVSTPVVGQRSISEAKRRTALVTSTSPPEGDIALLLDDAEVGGRVVESFSPAPGDGGDVLDADPEPPGEVDAGLDGKTHPGHQGLSLALDHLRRFGGGSADSVAGAVNELVAEPSVRDPRAGHPVDLLAGDARSNRLDRCLLCQPHDLVHLSNLRRGGPHPPP